MAHCPICGRIVAPRVDNPATPFCSPRCKAIDLGKWLDEDYRVASSDPAPEGADSEPTRD